MKRKYVVKMAEAAKCKVSKTDEYVEVKKGRVTVRFMADGLILRVDPKGDEKLASVAAAYEALFGAAKPAAKPKADKPAPKPKAEKKPAKKSEVAPPVEEGEAA